MKLLIVSCVFQPGNWPKPSCYTVTPIGTVTASRGVQGCGDLGKGQSMNNPKGIHESQEGKVARSSPVDSQINQVPELLALSTAAPQLCQNVCLSRHSVISYALTVCVCVHTLLSSVCLSCQLHNQVQSSSPRCQKKCSIKLHHVPSVV